MKNLGWIITGTALSLFFSYFAINKVEYSHSILDKNITAALQSDRIEFEKENHLANITYAVKNNTDYKIDDSYLIRFVLSRGFGAPGLHIKSVEPSILPGETFKGNFVWDVDTSFAAGGKFSVFMYVHKRGDNDFYPDIIAYDELPIHITKINLKDL